MGFLARERRRARAGRLAAPLLLAALACAPDGGPELPVARRVALGDDPAGSIHAEAGGRIWLGGPGGLRVAEGAGGAPRPVPLDGGDSARVVAEMDGRLLVRAGGRLLSLDPATGATLGAAEGEAGRVLADVRGRWLLVASPGGGVRGLDPRSLEPLWAWPSLGGAAAAALSPEGDRAYLALPRDGDGTTLLGRDLQTGRALRSDELAGEVTGLVAGRRGELFAVLAGQGGGGAVAALLPGADGLRPLWRRRLRALGLEREGPGETEVGARLSPDGSRLVLFAAGNDAGLRVLDAETGESRGRVRGPVRDAAFSADGASLYLLTPAGVGEARVP